MQSSSYTTWCTSLCSRTWFYHRHPRYTSRPSGHLRIESYTFSYTLCLPFLTTNAQLYLSFHIYLWLSHWHSPIPTSPHPTPVRIAYYYSRYHWWVFLKDVKPRLLTDSMSSSYSSFTFLIPRTFQRRCISSSQKGFCHFRRL